MTDKESAEQETEDRRFIDEASIDQLTIDETVDPSPDSLPVTKPTPTTLSPLKSSNLADWLRAKRRSEAHEDRLRGRSVDRRKRTSLVKMVHKEWHRDSHSKLDVQNNAKASCDPIANDGDVADDSDSDESVDDVDVNSFQSRRARLNAQTTNSIDRLVAVDDEGSLKIRSSLYDKLFDYQKYALKWLWALHGQQSGAILGDEMGLGKTAQIVSFLGALHTSGGYRRSLVLCPMTLLRHWMDEILKWYPWLRICLLHDGLRRHSGTGDPRRVLKAAIEDEAGILITTYEHFRIYARLLLPIDWGYVILDEGHKIKNPDADITLLVKQLHTRHRVIISGYPVQNRLTELWSLFDFIFPGKLGTLPVFETEFSIPIQVGGYKNASQLSVSTAMKCVMILREIIRPYMLIRRKQEVDVKLPNKKEHVLFCRLSTEQRDLYKTYITSAEVETIIREKQRVLAGIDALRKICNHPDLYKYNERMGNFGGIERSGKLKLTVEVLQLWKEEGAKSHMRQLGFVHLRMDGTTPARERSHFIDSFNTDPEIFAFLLTTRVGGVGVNLTGANRVLLYDPDWNPSVDIQAKERVWRIGQTREVQVYRLITTGTIEEKIYKRQMFKKRLTDEVVQMRSQKRQFDHKDIGDLFTLNEEITPTTSSSQVLDMKSPNAESPLSKLIYDGSISSAVDQSNVESASLKESQQALSQATAASEEAKTLLLLAGEKITAFDVHKPTWTGRNGIAGAPPCFEQAAEYGLRLKDNVPGVASLMAPSSADLLSGLVQKQTSAPQSSFPAIAPESERRPLPQRSTAAAKKPRTDKEGQKTVHVSRPEKTKQSNAEFEALPADERAAMRAMVIDLFKQRGNMATPEQLKHLATRIDASKRPAFRSLVYRMAVKSEKTQFWILDSNQ